MNGLSAQGRPESVLFIPSVEYPAVPDMKLKLHGRGAEALYDGPGKRVSSHSRMVDGKAQLLLHLCPTHLGGRLRPLHIGKDREEDFFPADGSPRYGVRVLLLGTTDIMENSVDLGNTMYLSKWE